MKEEILRILELEKQGKLTTEQAAELLAALADHRAEPAGAPQAAAAGPSVEAPFAPPPAPPFSSPRFATMRGVVSTGGVVIADAVQAAVKSAMNAVHHKDGENGITMSRYEPPTLDASVYADNSINVSQFSRVQLTRSRLCGNNLQAATIDPRCWSAPQRPNEYASITTLTRRPALAAAGSQCSAMT